MKKILLLLLPSFITLSCTDYYKLANKYEKDGDASIYNKLYEEVKPQLIRDFGEPIEVETSKFHSFHPFLFNGPNFSKKEGRKLEEDYLKELKEIREWRSTINGGGPISIDSYEYSQYESKLNELNNRYYQIYSQKNGKTDITVKQFLDDYIVKHPEISIEEAAKILSNNIDDIETFTSYYYKYHDAISGVKIGQNDFNDLIGILNVNVNFLDGKVESVYLMKRNASSNDKRIKAEVSWPLILICAILIYIFGYRHLKNSSLVVFTGWKSIFFTLLTSIPLYILLIEYSDPNLNLIYDNIYFYVFLFLFFWTAFISYKNNVSIKNTLLSLLFRIGLLILLPIFFIGFLLSFGYGKKDLRYKDGTKGNMQTKAIGTMGAVLTLLIGPFMKK